MSAEPYFEAPVLAVDRVVRLRSDAYGKGYFGASRSGGRAHEGIDILSPVGTPVRASKSGRVSMSTSSKKGYGECIEIFHPDGLKTRYAHLLRREAVAGDWVLTGQVIGFCGKSGNAVNPHIKPHLHFEIRSSDRAMNPSAGFLDPSIRVIS